MYKRRKFKYPTRYDIEQTLGEFAKRKFVDHFAGSRGVFVTKANQHGLAVVLSKFFYSNEDVEDIRNVAYKTTETEILTGFTVSVDDEVNPAEAIQNLIENNSLGNDIEISPIRRVEDENGIHFTCDVTYLNKKPGRIEFLQEELRSFGFQLSTKESNRYDVKVTGNQPADTKVAKDIFRKALKRKGVIYELNQLELSTPNTIRFFDILSEEGLGEDWTIREVKQLTLRKSDDEDDKIEADQGQLVGITQAVLDGINLRENDFVKQTESSGYRFTSMTYRFVHELSSKVIDIKAEFKLRPKVFIVDIVNTWERVDAEDNLDKLVFEPKEKFELKSCLYDYARLKFKELKKD